MAATVRFLRLSVESLRCEFTPRTTSLADVKQPEVSRIKVAVDVEVGIHFVVLTN